jgi:hypothetical protein
MTGLDTETHDGQAILIATSQLYTLFPRSFEECLEFILSVGDDELVCWNADYDIAAMLKFLSPGTLEHIYQNHQWRWTSRLPSWTTDGFIHLHYLPRKFLRLWVDERKITIYDLQQFYNMKLENAARKFLGEKKQDPGVDWRDLRAALSGDPRFPKEKRDQIIDYCMHDARLVEMLAGETENKFGKIGISFENPISCASLSLRVFEQKMNFSSIPAGYNEMARESFRGGMIECLRAGYFPRAWYIDLRSAYPSAIRDLVEMPLIWKPVVEKPEDSATYAAIECAVHVPCTWFKGCLPYSTGGPLIYPVGRWRTWVDLYTFRQVERLGLIEQIYGGIQGIGDSKEFPFREEIERLYLERGKDEQKKWAIKIVLNSLYGKFAETIEERFTPHTNFFMAAEITARTRWRLIQDINPEDVIFYATDGVFLCRKPEGLVFGADLGQWSEAEEIRDLVVVGSGVYTYRHLDGSVETKFRGFSSQADLYTLLDNQSHIVRILLQRNQKLGVTVRTGRWDRFNVIHTDERELNVNFDRKRRWEKVWTAQELLHRSFESLPWSVGDQGRLFDDER